MTIPSNRRSGRRSASQAQPRTRRRRTARSRRLPRPGRVLALMLFAISLAGLVALVHGPWLRIERVAFGGTRFTAPAVVERLLDAYRGTPLLALDSGALAERLLALPAVAGARIEPRLPDELRVTIDEKAPTFVWLTSAVRLVGADDGTLIGQWARDAELPPELAALPLIDDQRTASRALIVGDAIDSAELRLGLDLLALDPGRLDSSADGYGVRIDDVYGFVLVSRSPAWRAAIGFPEQDSQGGSDAAARLDRQVAAVRTLFATTREENVTWIDARNPGKVYWAP